MKNFFTLTLCFLTLSLTAQVDYPFPYNPDVNSDGYIGINDLMELLSIYGEEFGSDQLFSTSDQALVVLGLMNRPECEFQCSQLNGDWKIADVLGIAFFREIILSDSTYHWCLSTDGYAVGGVYNNVPSYTIIRPYDLRMRTDEAFNINECACLTRAYPIVEYSYCTGGTSIYDPGVDSFQTCVNERLLEGWHLLGGISRDSGNSSRLQAFWKYTD